MLRDVFNYYFVRSEECEFCDPGLLEKLDALNEDAEYCVTISKSRDVQIAYVGKLSGSVKRVFSGKVDETGTRMQGRIGMMPGGKMVMIFPVAILFLFLFGEKTSSGGGWLIGLGIVAFLICMPAIVDSKNDEVLLGKLGALFASEKGESCPEQVATSDEQVDQTYVPAVSKVAAAKRSRPSIIIIGCIALVFVFSAGRSAFRQIALWRDHAETTGVITEMPENSHGVVYYTYEIDGVEFTGASQPESGPESEPVAVDSKVKVHYCPARPSMSSLKQPQLPIPFVPIVPVFFAFFFYNGYLMWTGKRPFWDRKTFAERFAADVEKL